MKKFPLEPIEKAVVKSSYETVLEVFKGDYQLKIADVLKGLAGRHLSDRSVKRLLKAAVDNGDLFRPRQGVYQRTRKIEETGSRENDIVPTT